jgi:hypothetical protein
MEIPTRSILTAGVAVIGASAIAIAPSVQPPPPVAPAIQLTAAVQTAPTSPTAQPVDVDLGTFLFDWAKRIVVPPSPFANFPTPQFLPTVTPGSIGSSIKNIYNAVEPWVRYGFDHAAYAVGWIPFVGWLAPQIPIFYNLGERIARSITYNIADWLDGRITFWQGLINVGIDTVNSFIFFVNDQLAFWLPPLPPIPPIPGLAGSTTSASGSAAALQAPTGPTTPNQALQQIGKGAAGLTTTAASTTSQPATNAKLFPTATNLNTGPAVKRVLVAPTTVTKAGATSPAADVAKNLGGVDHGTFPTAVTDTPTNGKTAHDNITSGVRKANVKK